MPPWAHKGLTRGERAVLRESYWQQAAAGRGPDECWPWPGPLRSAGYGDAYSSPQGERYAHRVAWTRTHGAIPRGLLVCHRCDNTLCVNPAHLFLGTYSQNTRDSVAKGRWSKLHAGPRGPRKSKYCKRGHLRNRRNTYFYGRDRASYCRICRTERQRERRQHQAGIDKPRRS